MAKQGRSAAVIDRVLEEVSLFLRDNDETLLRIPEICAATNVNYGSIYHHFGSREGVIDAAYEMLFRQLAEEDLARLEAITEGVSTREEYLANIATTMGEFTLGEQRQANRRLRVRILAISITRPALRHAIATIQQDFIDRFSTVMSVAQDRGWMSTAIPARSMATGLQAVVFGRILDDIVPRRIDDDEWSNAVNVLFAALSS